MASTQRHGESSVLDGWQKYPFTSADITRDVYQRGSGPCVVVVHEIPGITPTVARFAMDVVNAGFTVLLPDLVGTPGKMVSQSYIMSSLMKVCIAREFTTMAQNKTSPIVSWLRSLARHGHEQAGGKGVGAVGMCFSGGFALGMMVDEIMVAPVLAQPSLPFAIGKGRGADLGLSPDDAVVVAERARQGCEVLGLKFTKDKLIGDRFASLRDLLGDSFIAVEIPSHHKKDHSTLTEQRDDASVERVIDFFTKKLK
jgi:dienelactone hydrolase